MISSVERDGRPVFRDLRRGVCVGLRAAGQADRAYVERCFQEYGIVTDPAGRHAAMYKPSQLIGLEFGISVASVGLRREATGAAAGWSADVLASAKRDLRAGEIAVSQMGYQEHRFDFAGRGALRSGVSCHNARAG